MVDDRRKGFHRFYFDIRVFGKVVFEARAAVAEERDGEAFVGEREGVVAHPENVKFQEHFLTVLANSEKVWLLNS